MNSSPTTTASTTRSTTTHVVRTRPNYGIKLPRYSSSVRLLPARRSSGRAPRGRRLVRRCASRAGPARSSDEGPLPPDLVSAAALAATTTPSSEAGASRRDLRRRACVRSTRRSRGERCESPDPASELWSDDVYDRKAAQRLWAAVVLSPRVEVCEALLAGVAVPLAGSISAGSQARSQRRGVLDDELVLA